MHRLRGNAMLELVLLLPMYMLVLYVVVTMGEYGQVTTQLVHAARYTAWQPSNADSYPETTDTKNTVGGMYTHFGNQASATGGSRMIQPLRLNGSRKTGESMPNNSRLVVEGSHAYAVRNLPDPLYGKGAAVAYYESIYADGHPSLNKIAETAMDGDTAASRELPVPWMRRQYASVRVAYTPMGKFISTPAFRTMHTVLRGVTWRTQEHEPYAFSKYPNLLRAVDAYPVDDKVAAPGDNLHQIDGLTFTEYMDPAPTGGP